MLVCEKAEDDGDASPSISNCRLPAGENVFHEAAKPNFK
jgi:hypothetical protein